MTSENRTGRRSFLRRAMRTGVAAPVLVRASTLGLGGAVPPSDRIAVGVVGLGGRGRYDTEHFMKEKDVHVPAVCDCFAERRKLGKQVVDKFYGNSGCKAYRHHEELLERNDIDAIVVATGDRWHAVMSVLASRAGKDVYSEKPFTLSIGEGRALVQEMKKNKTVWQCGTQRRSIPGYKFVVDLVREGRIGKLHTMTLSSGTGEGWRQNVVVNPEAEPDPDVFDYDRWLGQAPQAPYSSERVRCWRNNWATGAGSLADMGAHYVEIAQWAYGDPEAAAIEYDGWGVWHPQPNFNNTPHLYNVTARYADNVRIVFNAGIKGCRFDGDEGFVHITDFGTLTSERPSILGGKRVPEGIWKLMHPHIRDFLDCVKTRRQPVSYPEAAHRAHSIVHCANLCLRLGRTLRWDPKKERFLGDDDANGMISRPMRQPWSIV